MIQEKARLDEKNTLQGGALRELTRAGTVLTGQKHFKELVKTLVDQSVDITSADQGSFYLTDSPGNPVHWQQLYKRGRFETPLNLQGCEEMTSFLVECREAILLTERKKSPFLSLLLSHTMNSGIALPVTTADKMIGVLILNSRQPLFFDHDRFLFLDSITHLAGGLLNSSRLYDELKEHLKRIETLKEYQESVFNSMTNLLVTTDAQGSIRYMNRAAVESFQISLEKISLETSLESTLGAGLGRKTRTAIRETLAKKYGVEM